jgi:hypothetical protein
MTGNRKSETGLRNQVKIVSWMNRKIWNYTTEGTEKLLCVLCASVVMFQAIKS